MTSLQWGYASDDVASLVWLELLLCAAHNFYWRKCEMCGREELTRSKRRSRFCRECRDSGGFAAQYQRQRREALPETVKANRRAVNRDRMRLLRGDISPEEFLRQHPGYRAREGSAFRDPSRSTQKAAEGTLGRPGQTFRSGVQSYQEKTTERTVHFVELSCEKH